MLSEASPVLTKGLSQGMVWLILACMALDYLLSSIEII